MTHKISHHLIILWAMAEAVADVVPTLLVAAAVFWAGGLLGMPVIAQYCVMMAAIIWVAKR